MGCSSFAGREVEDDAGVVAFELEREKNDMAGRVRLRRMSISMVRVGR